MNRFASTCRIWNRLFPIRVADGDVSTGAFAEFSSKWRSGFSHLRGGSYNRTVVPENDAPGAKRVGRAGLEPPTNGFVAGRSRSMPVVARFRLSHRRSRIPKGLIRHGRFRSIPSHYR